MKFLVLFALTALAVAEPEADPATVYTNGVFHTNLENLQKGVHTQYTGPVGTLYNTHKVVQAPVVYNKMPVTYTHPYMTKPVVYTNTKPFVYGSPFVQKLFKREAEAESEADPLTIYSQGYPYQTAVSGWPYATYAKPWAPVTYTKPVYQTYGNIYNPYRLYKREAEAESEADPLTIYKTGLPYAQYAHPLTYGAQPWATPVTYAKPAMYPTYGSVYGNIYNPLRLYKREAEAEADPLKIYHNAGLYQPTYAYSNVYTTPYTTTPYVNTPYIQNAWTGVSPYMYY